jgi:predicted ATPase
MSETTSPRGAIIIWDEDRVKSLLYEPGQLLQEEPWSSWIKQQGGLASVHASLRSLPLSDRQRKTLQALLAEPGASLQKYALSLHVSVATFVRYRASLVKTLAAVLNARLLDRQPARPPAAQAVPEPHTNLPYQRMPLIGRDQEVETVRSLLLDPQVNLLTITGPGGIGKTRLALQIAADLLGEFADGAYFVSLASITSPELVAPTILQVLGLKAAENQPTLNVLKAHLQEKRILLVLDNFEQVAGAAPLLGEVLAEAPGLKVIVTSRAVLHLYGEHEFAVPPLATPDLSRLPSVDNLGRVPAVALFVSRAQAVNVGFRLNEENAAAVAELCVRLEGIPLALELAAARIKLFAPRALLKELNHRLALLSSKSLDLAPRHQTLRNAIAWSFQLLSPEEQALFTQLGVFFGGCTLEAAEAVCCPKAQSDGSLLELLASLVDKSMLLHKLMENGEPRFMLLETIREYSLEQLEAAGQTEAARQRHLAYFLALVEAIEPGPREPDLPAWMKRLEGEHDNLRAALQWALEQRDSESCLRIAGAVWRFWQIHGHVEEGCRWMQSVLALSRGQVSQPRAKALWGAGWLNMVKGTLQQSRRYFEEGALISRELEDPRYLGLSLHGIGAVARGQGDFEGAQVAFRESLPLFQDLGRTEDIAWTFEHLGATAIELGDFAQSVTYLTQGLELFHELGQRWPCAEALTFLGHAALQQQEYEQAETRYREALAIYQELDDRQNVASINSYIGATVLGRGDVERAVLLYKENLVLAREMKDYWGLAWGLERLAEAADRQGRPEHAACLWGAADALRKESGVLWQPGFHSNYAEPRFSGLKCGLGEERWQQLWDRGQRMSLEEAVAYALEV